MKDKSTEIQNIKKNPYYYNGDVLSISSGLSPPKEVTLQLF